jgi:hypothetical protein
MKTVNFKNRRSTNFTDYLVSFVENIRNIRCKNILAILVITSLSFGTIGCKSSKKALAAKAEQEAKLAREREAQLKKEEADRLKKIKDAEEAKRAPYKRLKVRLTKFQVLQV